MFFLEQTRFSSSPETRPLILPSLRPFFSEMNIRIAFLFGLTKSNPDQQRLLDDESRQFEDVIQSRNFFDSYVNLTAKSISMLRWTNQFCPRTGLLLKTDDDIFIRLDNLLR